MRQSTGMQLAEPNLFEKQIESFQQKSQEKHCTAVQNIQAEALSGRFNRLLEIRIIPTLGRIGFDEQFCWALLKMTGSAWKLIEQVGDNIELMYPVLQENIEEI